MRSASAAEVRPIRGRSSKTSTQPSTSPSTPATPLDGWICAEITCSSVVLPAPLGPITTQRSVSSTSQLMSLIKVEPFRTMLTPARSTTAAMASTYSSGTPQEAVTYFRAMDSLPSVRMTANLNSMIRVQQSIEQAERAIVGADVAHHVVDPDDVLRLDPLQASTLDAALEALLAAEFDGWFLALPVPGSLAPLRGPAAFNLAAVEQGEAVVASAAGLGLVPIRVGQAVQWRIFTAERPLAPSSPYEAEQALNEVVLDAAATLSRLEIAGGARPTPAAEVLLAPGYSKRQRVTAQRAARLLAACDAALLDDGASISSFEADRRARELRRVRAKAGDALGSAVSWLR